LIFLLDFSKKNDFKSASLPSVFSGKKVYNLFKKILAHYSELLQTAMETISLMQSKMNSNLTYRPLPPEKLQSNNRCCSALGSLKLGPF